MPAAAPCEPWGRRHLEGVKGEVEIGVLELGAEIFLAYPPPWSVAELADGR